MKAHWLLGAALGLGAMAAPAPQLLPTKPDPYHLNLPSSSPRLDTLQQRLTDQQQKKAAQQRQLHNLHVALAQLSSQQKSALAELNDLAQRVAAQQNQQRDLSQRVTQARAELEDTQAQLTVMAAQVSRLESDVRQILQGLYRQRSRQYLELLSEANSLPDLIIQGRYANISGAHNVRVIQALRGQREELQTQRQRQKEQANNLLQLQAQQRDSLSRLRAAQAQQQALIARLKQSQAGQQALALQTQAQQAQTAQDIGQTIGKLIDERNQIEMQRRRLIEAERVRRAEELRRIREAQERARQEAARLAALRQAQARAQALARQQRAQALERERTQLRERQRQLEDQQRASDAALTPLPRPSGPLGFPLPGGALVQGFSEDSPWVVLQGPASAQASAALGGNVLAVTNYASLGWVVLIDHGELVTAYLGLLEPRVSPGQAVTRGQALGSIGGSPIFGAGRMAFQVNRVSGGSRLPIPPAFR